MKRRHALTLPWALAKVGTDAAAAASAFDVFADGLAQPRGLLFDPDGALFVAEQRSGSIARVGSDGKAVRIASGFESPHDIARGRDGRLYVADTSADKVAVIEASGKVSTYLDDLESPVDLDFSPGGELWVCELSGQVRAFTAPGRSRTVARLKGPHGLAFAPSGDTFINDWRGNRVVRLAPDGALHGVAELPSPVGLTLGPAGSLYVAQPQARRLSKILSDGKVVPIATGLQEPRDPVFDRAGNLFVAETMAGRVLKFRGAP